MDLIKEYDESMRPLRDIVGAAMEVYNEWGGGLLESAYEAGMKHLLEQTGHLVERQKSLPLFWKGEPLDDGYRMDLVVDGIIVELKACKFVTADHKRQLDNYLRITQTSYGLLINFSDKQVYAEARRLYTDGTLEKVPLRMGYGKE